MQRQEKHIKLLLLAAVVVAMMAVTGALVLPAAANTKVLGRFNVLGPSDSIGVVEVSGTNDGKTSIVLSDITADFGTIDPVGTVSDSDDVVEGFQGDLDDQGSYYVWKSATGKGLKITVKSNRSWYGTIRASENSGTSRSMTVSSGVLRYVEGPAPASYTDCANAEALSTTEAQWKTDMPKGIHEFVHYYCLRSDWNDDPGTFVSSVIFTVSQ